MICLDECYFPMGFLKMLFFIFSLSCPVSVQSRISRFTSVIVILQEKVTLTMFKTKQKNYKVCEKHK